MEEIDYFLTYDEPVPYKDLLIYPAIMQDYIMFHRYVNCLILEKNSIPDIEIISMSELQFIYHTAEEGQPFLNFLYNLLGMVLKVPLSNIRFVMDNNKPYFYINNEKYDNEDFLNIKKIIAKQNDIDLIDETISKEIRDQLAEAQRIKMQQNVKKVCSLEDQMICVSISSSYRLEDIYKLTIRKFSRILQRIDHKLHYEIYLSASMSGMVEFKDKSFIQHWMNDLEVKDKYADVKMTESQLQSRIDTK